MTAWLRQRFTEEELVNLTLAIVAFNGWKRMHYSVNGFNTRTPVLRKSA